VDALGFATYFFYDALNRNEATRDAVGNSTYYFYDPVGSQSVVVDSRRSATYYFYDLLSRRKVIRDALNNRTYFGYDAVGNQTRILDARRNATYFFYDTLDRLSVQRNSLYEPTYFFYDGVGNRIKMTDARFNTTYYFYNGLKQTTAMRDALANSTYYFYDLARNRTVMVDARASATYFFYDPLNRTAAVRNALANLTYYGYDAASNQTRIQNARLNTTYFTYDRLNRLDGVIDPLGNAVLSRYDQVGNLTALNRGVTGAVLGVTTYYFYDGARRRTATVDGAGGGSYYFYDQTSNRTRLRNQLAHTTYFGYDRLNRVVQIQDAVAAKTYFAYDAVGNQIRVTDPLNHSLLTQYDNLNRIYAFRYADTGSTYFFYDRVGNYVRIQDARANTTYFAYDAVNRLTRMQDALGRTVYYEYDPVGNRSKFIDVESASVSYTYDRRNRTTNLTYATAGTVVSDGLKSTPYYVYDAVGNVIAAGDLWGGHLMVYDADNRLTQHRYPNGNFVYFRYDPRSNVTARVYPGAAGVSGAAYDNLDRQTKVQSPSGATAYFSYDAASNLTQRLLGNSAKLQVTYDAAERSQNWRYSTSAGSPLTYFDYTRNAKGLITKSIREATHTVYYMYDANDRLTVEIWRGATPETYAYRYAYDLAGNRTKATMNGQNTYYEYDKANQLTRKGTNALFASATYYTYDRNGSLTDIAEASGTTKFAYNAAGLVARMRWRDASSTYFYYDAALQRYAIKANGTLNYFLWDGLDVLQEQNADGTVKEEYTQAKVPLAGIGQLVEVNRPGQAQAKLYPVMDQRGTITKYVQSDGTTVFASREYDAFGQLIPNSSVGTWPGIFGYQGQAWQEILSADGAQRLLLSPARLYDPSLGIFLSRDPLAIGNPSEIGSPTLTGVAKARKNSYASDRGRWMRRGSLPVGPLVTPYGYAREALLETVDPWGLQQVLRYLQNQGAPFPGMCRGFEWKTQWQLGMPSGEAGVIVQEVTMWEQEKGCSDTPFDPPDEDHYWEAWEVIANDTVTQESGQFPQGNEPRWDDRLWRKNGRCCTEGEIRFTLIAHYYEGLTISMLESSGWLRGSVPPASTLHATREEPNTEHENFWSAPTAGPVNRWIRSEWECCFEYDNSNRCPKGDPEEGRRIYNQSRVTHGDGAPPW